MEGMNDDTTLDSPRFRPQSLEDFAARGFRRTLHIKPVAGTRPPDLFANRAKARRWIITDDEEPNG